MLIGLIVIFVVATIFGLIGVWLILNPKLRDKVIIEYKDYGKLRGLPVGGVIVLAAMGTMAYSYRNFAPA